MVITDSGGECGDDDSGGDDGGVSLIIFYHNTITRRPCVETVELLQNVFDRLVSFEFYVLYYYTLL